MKSYTDIEQSKKLAEILTLESADMYYFLDPTPVGNIYHLVVQQIAFGVKTREPEYDKGDIPCWSLAALINILPQFIEFKGDKYYIRFMKEYIEYANDEISITGRCLHTTGNNNLVDACYEMIIKLDELKLL